MPNPEDELIDKDRQANQNAFNAQTQGASLYNDTLKQAQESQEGNNIFSNLGQAGNNLIQNSMSTTPQNDFLDWGRAQLAKMSQPRQAPQPPGVPQGQDQGTPSPQPNSGFQMPKLKPLAPGAQLLRANAELNRNPAQALRNQDKWTGGQLSAAKNAAEINRNLIGSQTQAPQPQAPQPQAPQPQAPQPQAPQQRKFKVRNPKIEQGRIPVQPLAPQGEAPRPDWMISDEDLNAVPSMTGEAYRQQPQAAPQAPTVPRPAPKPAPRPQTAPQPPDVPEGRTAITPGSTGRNQTGIPSTTQVPPEGPRLGTMGMNAHGIPGQPLNFQAPQAPKPQEHPASPLHESFPLEEAPQSSQLQDEDIFNEENRPESWVDRMRRGAQEFGQKVKGFFSKKPSQRVPYEQQYQNVQAERDEIRRGNQYPHMNATKGLKAAQDARKRYQAFEEDLQRRRIPGHENDPIRFNRPDMNPEQIERTRAYLKQKADDLTEMYPQRKDIGDPNISAPTLFATEKKRFDHPEQYSQISPEEGAARSQQALTNLEKFNRDVKIRDQRIKAGRIPPLTPDQLRHDQLIRQQLTDKAKLSELYPQGAKSIGREDVERIAQERLNERGRGFFRRPRPPRGGSGGGGGRDQAHFNYIQNMLNANADGRVNLRPDQLRDLNTELGQLRQRNPNLMPDRTSLGDRFNNFRRRQANQSRFDHLRQRMNAYNEGRLELNDDEVRDLGQEMGRLIQNDGVDFNHRTVGERVSGALGNIKNKARDFAGRMGQRALQNPRINAWAQRRFFEGVHDAVRPDLEQWEREDRQAGRRPLRPGERWQDREEEERLQRQANVDEHNVLRNRLVDANVNRRNIPQEERQRMQDRIREIRTGMPDYDWDSNTQNNAGRMEELLNRQGVRVGGRWQPLNDDDERYGPERGQYVNGRWVPEGEQAPAQQGRFSRAMGIAGNQARDMGRGALDLLNRLPNPRKRNEFDPIGGLFRGAKNVGRAALDRLHRMGNLFNPSDMEGEEAAHRFTQNFDELHDISQNIPIEDLNENDMEAFDQRMQELFAHDNGATMNSMDPERLRQLVNYSHRAYDRLTELRDPVRAPGRAADARRRRRDEDGGFFNIADAPRDLEFPDPEAIRAARGGAREHEDIDRDAIRRMAQARRRARGEDAPAADSPEAQAAARRHAAVAAAGLNPDAHINISPEDLRRARIGMPPDRRPGGGPDEPPQPPPPRGGGANLNLGTIPPVRHEHPARQAIRDVAGMAEGGLRRIGGAIAGGARRAGRAMANRANEMRENFYDWQFDRAHPQQRPIRENAVNGMNFDDIYRYSTDFSGGSPESIRFRSTPESTLRTMLQRLIDMGPQIATDDHGRRLFGHAHRALQNEILARRDREEQLRQLEAARSRPPRPEVEQEGFLSASGRTFHPSPGHAPIPGLEGAEAGILSASGRQFAPLLPEPDFGDDYFRGSGRTHSASSSGRSSGSYPPIPGGDLGASGYRPPSGPPSGRSSGSYPPPPPGIPPSGGAPIGPARPPRRPPEPNPYAGLGPEHPIPPRAPYGAPDLHLSGGYSAASVPSADAFAAPAPGRPPGEPPIFMPGSPGMYPTAPSPDAGPDLTIPVPPPPASDAAKARARNKIFGPRKPAPAPAAPAPGPGPDPALPARLPSAVYRPPGMVPGMPPPFIPPGGPAPAPAPAAPAPAPAAPAPGPDPAPAGKFDNPHGLDTIYALGPTGNISGLIADEDVDEALDRLQRAPDSRQKTSALVVLSRRQRDLARRAGRPAPAAPAPAPAPIVPPARLHAMFGGGAPDPSLIAPPAPAPARPPLAPVPPPAPAPAPAAPLGGSIAGAPARPLGPRGQAAQAMGPTRYFRENAGDDERVNRQRLNRLEPLPQPPRPINRIRHGDDLLSSGNRRALANQRARLLDAGDGPGTGRRGPVLPPLPPLRPRPVLPARLPSAVYRPPGMVPGMPPPFIPPGGPAPAPAPAAPAPGPAAPAPAPGPVPFVPRPGRPPLNRENLMNAMRQRTLAGHEQALDILENGDLSGAREPADADLIENYLERLRNSDTFDDLNPIQQGVVTERLRTLRNIQAAQRAHQEDLRRRRLPAPINDPALLRMMGGAPSSDPQDVIQRMRSQALTMNLDGRGRDEREQEHRDYLERNRDAILSDMRANTHGMKYSFTPNEIDSRSDRRRQRRENAGSLRMRPRRRT